MRLRRAGQAAALALVAGLIAWVLAHLTGARPASGAERTDPRLEVSEGGTASARFERARELESLAGDVALDRAIAREARARARKLRWSTRAEVEDVLHDARFALASSEPRSWEQALQRLAGLGTSLPKDLEAEVASLRMQIERRNAAR